MAPSLPSIIAKPKTGGEEFRSGGASIGITLDNYWRWAHSDLLVNIERGVLAEFIVACALGLSSTQTGVRLAWEPYDLVTPEGLKIEVKSAAYVQSWAQKDFSHVTFTVTPRLLWSETEGWTLTATRSADVYVLALLEHKTQETIDPLDLDQWSFFVVPTQVLNQRQRSQHSITLPSLAKLGLERVTFTGLAKAINTVGVVAG
jgi:hypothetical protein